MDLKYWRSVGANEAILQDGYTIPFYTNPKSAILKNNTSALNNKKFVEGEIGQLLRSGRIVETARIPYVVNPLSVSVKDKKRRLILDCRHINPHVFKDNIKFEDCKLMLDFVEEGGYMFKFDIRQGYHHIEINRTQTKFLGFSWVDKKGQVRYYVFLVLGFGITSGPFLFTKIMRVLIKHWRRHSIKIACFIDDGAGFENNFGEKESRLRRNIFKIFRFCDKL